MDEKSKEFVKECEANNTTVAVFIRLFSSWDMLNSEQRGAIIDSEIGKKRLAVKK